MNRILAVTDLGRTALTLAATLVLAACGGATGPRVAALPPLADDIPYDALGSGRIMFYRMGSDPAHADAVPYWGLYIVDVGERRSWEFTPQSAPAFESDTSFSFDLDHPSLSPGGSHILFGGRGLHEWPWIADPDGTGLARMGRELQKGTLSPSWGPDGSGIYYWSGPGGGGCGANLYAQPLNAVPRLVASAPIWMLRNEPVSVSASGNALFTAGECKNGERSYSDYGVHVLRIGAGTASLLIGDTAYRGDAYGSPVWSPDGSKIAYLESSTALAVMVADSDGSHRRQVTPSLRGAQSISWSPDGTRLLFDALRADGTSNLYVIGVDGSGMQAVTTLSGVEDRYPSWSR